MSYDVDFRVKVEGVDYWACVGDCEANTTWNVRQMIVESTGLSWMNCANNGYCKDVIPKIERGLFELENRPEKYKQYEAKNGWGTVKSTANFFREIISAWNRLKSDEPELADVATFWIC